MTMKHKRFDKSFKGKKWLKASILPVVALILAACGDTAATNTPVAPAAATPSAAATTAANPGTTPNAANPGNTTNAGNNGNNGQNQNGNRPPGFNPPVSGTIESFDANAKILTIKEADGKSAIFDTSNARLTKTDKISLDDFGKLLSPTEIVQVAGEKASDGSYNATRLILLDQAGQNQGQTGGGNNGAGRGQGQPGQGQGQLTPPANFTPNAGGQGRFGNGGLNNGVIVRNATLSGKQLTGTSLTGEAVTINLSDSTALVKRSAGSVTDLKTGQSVTVNFRLAQGSSTAQAVAITID